MNTDTKLKIRSVSFWATHEEIMQLKAVARGNISGYIRALIVEDLKRRGMLADIVAKSRGEL
jgi:hypothetical protein